MFDRLLPESLDVQRGLYLDAMRVSSPFLALAAFVMAQGACGGSEAEDPSDASRSAVGSPSGNRTKCPATRQRGP